MTFQTLCIFWTGYYLRFNGGSCSLFLRFVFSQYIVVFINFRPTHVVNVDIQGQTSGVIHKPRGQIFGCFWSRLSWSFLPNKTYVIILIIWSFCLPSYNCRRGLLMSPQELIQVTKLTKWMGDGLSQSATCEKYLIWILCRYLTCLKIHLMLRFDIAIEPRFFVAPKNLKILLCIRVRTLYISRPKYLIRINVGISTNQTGEKL